MLLDLVVILIQVSVHQTYSLVDHLLVLHFSLHRSLEQAIYYFSPEQPVFVIWQKIIELVQVLSRNKFLDVFSPILNEEASINLVQESLHPQNLVRVRLSVNQIGGFGVQIQQFQISRSQRYDLLVKILLEIENWLPSGLS